MSTSPFSELPGAVTAPQGFQAAMTNCGIKPELPDMTLILSANPATVAVTVTQNRFRAAPTYVTQAHAADGSARAIVVNSGNANAATGEPGLANAQRMAELTAQALDLAPEEVLVCSTGHIGDQLPMDKIESGIKSLVPALSPEGGEEAAQGIMTTDTFPKHLAVEFTAGEKQVRLGGICKGAGMICPHMATMLCFLTTDLALPAALLRTALKQAVDRSFNCLTVDGDMSTNDTVALLANGASGAKIESADDPAFPMFEQALGHVTRELAKMIARDGEGATKFVEIRVSGGEDYEHARRVGRAVANYNLLKTAIYGGDFNWGRLAAAVGSVDAAIDPKQVTLKMVGILAWDHGQVAEFDLAEARRRMQEKEIIIEIDLGLGAESATVWTCDLTPGYIECNAAYSVEDLG